MKLKRRFFNKWGATDEVEEFKSDKMTAGGRQWREDESVLADRIDLCEHHHQDDAVDDDAEDRQERQKYLQLKEIPKAWEIK